MLCNDTSGVIINAVHMYFNLLSIGKFVCNTFYHLQDLCLVWMTCHFGICWVNFDMFGDFWYFSELNSLWTAVFLRWTMFFLFCVIRFCSTWKCFLLSVMYLRKQKGWKTFKHDNSWHEECHFHQKSKFVFVVKWRVWHVERQFCVFMTFVRATFQIYLF